MCGSSIPCLRQHSNDHWRPQYTNCPYCHIDYQVIGKLETFADDVKYIVLKRNLTSLIPLEDLTRFCVSEGLVSLTNSALWMLMATSA